MTPAAPRPEPVTLALPGWAAVDEGVGRFDNARSWRWTKGDATVELTRWWGMPQHPGRPMVVASKTPVTVDGQPEALLRTSMFEGVVDEVDVLFLRGEGWQARLVCRACTAADRAATLSAITRRGPR